MARISLRQELEELRSELESLRKSGEPKTSSGAGEEGSTMHAISGQIGELQKMVQQMLDEAEETMSEHPVATVAGALALGIVIGRLTAR